jgi:hypothetical protein
MLNLGFQNSASKISQAEEKTSQIEIMSLKQPVEQISPRIKIEILDTSQPVTQSSSKSGPHETRFT